MPWRNPPPWADNFSGDSADSADITVEPGSGWTRWRSQAYIVPLPTRDGKATMTLIDPPGPEDDSIGGGRTTDTHVPTAAQFDHNAQNTRRNKWAAMMDFYPLTRFDPKGGHTAVFLRVNPTIWDNVPNQTRFGCYINGFTRTNQGVLQFTGDRVGDPSTRARELVEFNLSSEDPFDHPTRLYRVRIIEEEYKYASEWKLRWKAEIWRLAGGGLSRLLLGDSGWVVEDTVRNTYNVAISTLADS